MAQPLEAFVKHTIVGYILGNSFAEAVARIASLGEAYYCNALFQNIDHALARECRGLKPENGGVRKV